MAGSHTGINMLLWSLVFSWFPEENAPSIHYEINVHSYDKAYYLADAIYPPWPRFMKMIHSLWKRNTGGLRKNKRLIEMM
jgi:hypothetical protein